MTVNKNKFYTLVGFKDLNSYATFYKEIALYEIAIELFNQLSVNGKYQCIVLREDCNGVSKVIKVNKVR